MERVYLESSVISYLVSSPSQSVVVAGHQYATRKWWDKRRNEFELFISQEVIDEISLGNPIEAQKRVEITAEIARVKSDKRARELTQRLLKSGTLPAKAAADAMHLAISVTNGIDYLLTWNCKHLANAHIRRKIEEVCESLGYSPLVICTPDELLAEEDGNVQE